MPALQKMIFVGEALTDNVDALKQALAIAHANNDRLTLAKPSGCARPVMLC